MTNQWDEAWSWASKVNKLREFFQDPKWSWDCGFKLDFDGPLVHIESRFYAIDEGDSVHDSSWKGSMRVCSLCDVSIASFDFKENSLKALHKSVEAKLLIIRSKIEESLVVALKEIK